MVAELLLEHDQQLVWGGQVGLFLRWVRWLPLDLLLEHPSLPAGGAVAAALLARPELEVQRLLAMAERARRERPQRWSPYAEAIVEVTRSEVIEHGDVGAAVGHARRAVAAARAGADALTVGVLASLAQALFFVGDLDEARTRRASGRRAPRCAGTSPTAMLGQPWAARPGRRRATGEPRAREAWARCRRSASRAQRSQADSWTASLAHLALALALRR